MSGCDLRQPDDYTIGAQVAEKEMEALVAQVVDDFNRRNEGFFSVTRMDADSGFELSMLDGFLYERNYVVLHLDAELEAVRDYELPTVKELEEGIGDPGWSLEGAGRQYDLVMLLSRGEKSGRVVYKSGTSWKGKMTALFDIVGKARRLKHVGAYRPFRGFDGNRGAR